MNNGRKCARIDIYYFFFICESYRSSVGPGFVCLDILGGFKVKEICYPSNDEITCFSESGLIIERVVHLSCKNQ